MISIAKLYATVALPVQGRTGIFCSSMTSMHGSYWAFKLILAHLYSLAFSLTMKLSMNSLM